LILITGAGGFIGRHLATYLHENGQPVLASGRKKHDKFFNNQGIPYVKLDIAKKNDYSTIQNNNIKKIVHLAAIVPTKKKIHSTSEYLSVNGCGILQLLDFCVKNNVTKFVNISSVSVYGMSGKNGVKENVNLKPFGTYADYAIAKILAELFTDRYVEDFNLSAITLRLGYVFGDYSKEHLLLPRLINKALAGKEIIIEGTGEYVFDVVYINDCINAIDLALETSKTGIYNVGSEEPVSLNQVVKMVDNYVFKTTKRHTKIRYTDLEEIKKGYVMSIENSKKHLCYYPKYKGIEVIEKILDDYYENRNMVV